MPRRSRRSAPLAAVLLACVATACRAPSTVLDPSALPERGFEYYSGSDGVAGDLWLGFTTFTHAESGRTCVLLPVYHVAEARFYEEVQREMDAADVVLTEGVGGAPSLSPALFLTSYAFANYRRVASLAGLTHQGEAIAWRPNQRNADLRMAEFQASWPWSTPIGQALALPVVAVAWDTAIVLSWFERGGQALLGRGDVFRAAWRHWMVSDADDETDSSILLPGVIETRNERLLERLDEVAADEMVRRVAVPWGAAHFPSLKPELEDRGWTESDHRWVRAVSVRELLEDGDDDAERPDEAFDLFVPYLGQVRSHGAAWNLSLLLHAVSFDRRAGGESRLELLWELLLSLRRNAAAGEFELQLLPSLLGRPLLFEYRGRRDDGRLRFLWFFEV